jgi:hypothetical protein
LKHRASPRFWACYGALSPQIRGLADEKFRLLETDPHHPSLHFKRVGRFWSCRVGLRHRALGVTIPDGVLWFWIGTHAEYDQLVSRG